MEWKPEQKPEGGGTPKRRIRIQIYFDSYYTYRKKSGHAIFIEWKPEQKPEKVAPRMRRIQIRITFIIIQRERSPSGLGVNPNSG